MSLINELRQDNEANHKDNVRAIAERIASCGTGYKIVELMDAIAVAAGTLVNAFYAGPGIEMAAKRFVETFVDTVMRRKG
jgi:hypothetical protein